MLLKAYDTAIANMIVISPPINIMLKCNKDELYIETKPLGLRYWFDADALSVNFESCSLSAVQRISTKCIQRIKMSSAGSSMLVTGHFTGLHRRL